MFDNIGGKIKGLAIAVSGVGFVASAGGAIYLFSLNSSGYVLFGIGTLIMGFLLSWVSGLLIYGFGQLIENSEEIKENTAHLKYQSSTGRKRPLQRADRPSLRSGWKCPSCGKINDIDEETCECGTSQWDRPQNEL